MSPQIELARTLTIDKLASITPGDPGASHIGIAPIAGISASQVQQALEALKAYTDASTTGSHQHEIGTLPVATTGEVSTTKVVRADDARLSDARTPSAHTHVIADLPVAADNESSTSKIVRSNDSRLVGARVPTAGTTGQVLKKNSNTDYDMTWANETGGGGGSGHTVQDEGVDLINRTGLNFIGSPVTVTDDSANNRTNVTISAGMTVQDEGSGLTQRSILDFRGTPVTVTDDAANSRTAVTISPTYATVQEEGSSLTVRPTINLIGSLVAASDDAANNRTNITLATPTMSDLPTAAKTKDLVLYNPDSPLAANTGETGEYAIVRAGTITRIVARVVTAPVGAGIAVSVKKNGAQIHSMTIAAGSKTQNSTGLSLSVVDGDYLTMVPTSVGSTTAGAKLSVLCEQVVT